jgi:hypothetical protein
LTCIGLASLRCLFSFHFLRFRQRHVNQCRAPSHVPCHLGPRIAPVALPPPPSPSCTSFSHLDGDSACCMHLPRGLTIVSQSYPKQEFRMGPNRAPFTLASSAGGSANVAYLGDGPGVLCPSSSFFAIDVQYVSSISTAQRDMAQGWAALFPSLSLFSATDTSSQMLISYRTCHPW